MILKQHILFGVSRKTIDSGSTCDVTHHFIPCHAPISSIGLTKATRTRREAAARAQREAQLEAQLEELRVKMQGEINGLRAELAEAKVSSG